VAAKRINVIIWLIKAAELDAIKTSCQRNLVGLYFDVIYTQSYAMCLNAVSEIITTLGIEEDQRIIATNRFSSAGLVPAEEVGPLQNKVADFVKNTPVTVDVWQEVATDFTKAAVMKATTSIHATFAELAKKPGNHFTVLIINNDRLPLLEFLAGPLNRGLTVPAEGEILQLRFEGLVDGKKTNVKLVYASLAATE
jgi:hypothetical protein